MSQNQRTPQQQQWLEDHQAREATFPGFDAEAYTRLTWSIHGLDYLPHYQNRHWAEWGDPSNKCGPAAVFTMLRHYRLLIPTEEAFRLVQERWFDPRTSPDYGPMGTTYEGMQQMVRYYGGHPNTEGGPFRDRWIEGPGFIRHEYRGVDNAITGLRNTIDQRNPCVILVDWLNSLVGAHWMVAYAWDGHYLYCTNYDRYTNPGYQFGIPWDEVPGLLTGPLTELGGMREGRGFFKDDIAFLTLPRLTF